MTLVAHDIWVSGLLSQLCGKYLLSVVDDKALQRWDLSQDGQCVNVLTDAHGQFITCLPWSFMIRTEHLWIRTIGTSSGVSSAWNSPYRGN